MKKPSAKRMGVLQMIRDDETAHEKAFPGVEFVGCYLPGQTSHSLEKYGLTLWDLQSITMAEKAGLITRHKYNSWAKLTDEGRAMLERYAP